MSLSIAKDFRFISLLRFAFPTMIMMVFMSLYTIVDGIFISRFVGSNALSSANIVYPVLNLIIAVGVMFSSGGSALIAKKLGEHKEREANEDFSLILFTALGISVFILILGTLFLDPLVRILGATDVLIPYCKSYLHILLIFAPACILQLLFQTFFVTAGRPALGLTLTILGGITNMILDYIFMGPLNLGIWGAGLATGLGQTVPALFGLLYFISKRSSLHIVKPVFRIRSLLKSCSNGSSEMVTNISTAVVTFLFNMVMLRLAGESGVAAITIVLYGQFLFNALYFGFSMGVAPVISYNYGRKNNPLLQRIFKICTWFIAVSSLAATGMALFLSPYIVEIFTPKGSPTYELAKTGFFLFSFNYLFAGMNIFASSLFTAFSDGPVSALISFARTFVFITASILLLPNLLGVTGVWLSVPVAETITVLLSVFLFVSKRKKYQYVACKASKSQRGSANAEG